MLYLANTRDRIVFSQYIGDNAKESAKKEIQKDINWLKSLRPQPHWKPSEEQMDADIWKAGKKVTIVKSQKKAK